MAKKKSKRESKKEREPSIPLTEILGFDNIFRNDKVNFVIGLLAGALSAFLILSFISYFTTGSVDCSLIEHMRQGEFLNEERAFKNSCGSAGAYVSHFLISECFGLAAFVVPAFLLIVALRFMRIYELSLLKWFMGMAIVMIWASVTLAEFATGLFQNSWFNPGGKHGLYICNYLENIIGAPGLTIILGFIALALLTYVTAETIFIIRKMLNPVKYFTNKVKFTIINLNEERKKNREEGNGDASDEVATDEENAQGDAEEVQVEKDDDGEDVGEKDAEEEGGEVEDDEYPGSDAVMSSHEHDGSRQTDDIDIEIAMTNEEKPADSRQLVEEEELAPYDPKRDLEFYQYPTLDLLKKYDGDDKPHIDIEEQTANKNRIVEVLRNFDVEISSIKATVGPTITLYEITPGPKVRISKIRNLEDDIALSLSALGIRIIAPIPGKGTIGIEVPNAKPSIVSMESILNSKKFQETTMDLPCAIGKTITNEVYMFDLAKIPHLLVAGATGQGKSVGLNAIITSLLYKKHPAELKIVLIDPKKVEFSIYEPIMNHFLAKVPDDDAEPIITDVTKVVRTLNSLCIEMDTRYDLLKAAGARNIKEYNKKFISRHLNPNNGHRYMPYIVVIIDEFGDLIMTAGKEIELPIARIAQLARAVGIHMVIATQRPTTTIITGNIKANFPGRIAFKVSAMIDSKTILDRPGANQLIGRGDMLFLSGNEPVRVQCAFVDTPEVERINEFIAKQQGYLKPFELPDPDSAESDEAGDLNVDLSHLDPLFEDAARMIVLEQLGSTSGIQRKFSIGYNRAGRLMDQLEQAGIVGPASGSKPREIYVQDENSLNKLLRGLKK